MEVRLAVMADAASVDQSGKLSVFGIFDVVFAKSLPAGHAGGSLVVSLDADRGDVGDHSIEMLFVDTDGSFLAKVTAVTTVPPLDDEASFFVVNGVFPIPLLPLPALGPYQWDIFLDGRYATSVRLDVRLAQRQ